MRRNFFFILLIAQNLLIGCKNKIFEFLCPILYSMSLKYVYNALKID